MYFFVYFPDFDVRLAFRADTRTLCAASDWTVVRFMDDVLEIIDEGPATYGHTTYKLPADVAADCTPRKWHKIEERPSRFHPEPATLGALWVGVL